jgi:hypothetical protein
VDKAAGPVVPRAPWRHLDDPAHWRARAIEARTVAEHIADSLSKQMMLNVAAEYDQLAERAEQRIAQQQSSQSQ